MEHRKKIQALAEKTLCYGKRSAENLIIAFDVEKLPDSSNSGEYQNSSLATLGDSVAGLLLCEQYYDKKRKGEITSMKGSYLQNKVFDKVAVELGLPEMRFAGDRTIAEQEEHSQFKNDPSALFEAVLGAIYLDLGLIKLRQLWKERFFPLIEKHRIETDKSLNIGVENTEIASVTFESADESETEVIVYRPKRWKSQIKKNEVVKGQVYFDKSEARGFDGQGIYFYKGTVCSAAAEYEQRAGKSPECVLVYKIAITNLPKAKGDDMDFDTAWVKVEDSETCYCLKADEADMNIFAEIKPFAIVCLSEEKSTDIKRTAEQLGIIAI